MKRDQCAKTDELAFALFSIFSILSLFPIETLVLSQTFDFQPYLPYHHHHIPTTLSTGLLGEWITSSHFRGALISCSSFTFACHGRSSQVRFEVFTSASSLWRYLNYRQLSRSLTDSLEFLGSYYSWHLGFRRRTRRSGRWKWSRRDWEIRLQRRRISTRVIYESLRSTLRLSFPTSRPIPSSSRQPLFLSVFRFAVESTTTT